MAEFWGFPSKREYDRARRAIRQVERMEARPKKGRRVRGGGGGTDTYRAARGLVKGDVTADDASFMIDNVLPLAGGLDPVSGNPATEVAVANIQQETLEDNTPVTVVYHPDVLTDVHWELLVVERYRLVRGQVYAGYDGEDATFAIDNVVPLSSGLDPRADPTDTAEQLTIQNIHDDSGAADDKIVAIYNAVSNQWEALKKSGSRLQWGEVYSTVGAMTSWGSWGDGEVQFKDDAGSNDGSPIEVENRYPTEFATGTSVCCDRSFDPPRVVSGSCEEV